MTYWNADKHRVSKRNASVIFSNYSVKRLPIVIIFTSNITIELDVNDYSFAHITLALLLHYLVKCRSILAVYNSKCKLVAHASAQNIIARQQIIDNLLSPA